MDAKTAAAGILAALIVLGGIAIAAPAIGNAAGLGMRGPHAAANGSDFRAPGPWNHCGFGNASRPDNSTLEAFRDAVLNDDYQAAKNLSDTYGLGGPLFSRLNETAFHTYSEIVVLEKRLAQELGVNATSRTPGIGCWRPRMGMALQPGRGGMGFWQNRTKGACPGADGSAPAAQG
jgi:hypothetical protein